MSDPDVSLLRSGLTIDRDGNDVTVTVRAQVRTILAAMDDARDAVGCVLACARDDQVSLGVTIGPEIPKEVPVQQTTMTDEGKRLFTLNPVSPRGKTVPVQDVTWTIENGPGAGERIDVGDKSISAYIVSSDTPAKFQVRVTADADMGEGVTTIEELIEVTVTDPMATSLGLTIGEEVAKVAKGNA